MRALFWRRRNTRLITRLNTVIERSEQARMAFRPQPSRVVIDTSFLDREIDAHGAMGGGPSCNTGQIDGGGADQGPALAGDQKEIQEFAELAPRRRPRLTALLSKREAGRRERMASIEAETMRRELAAQREAEAQRQVAARLEEEALREQEARLAAEADLEEARRLEAEAVLEAEALRVAAAQHELAALREAEAQQRAIAAEKEAEAQRELAARLEAETIREQAARREAELQREAAARREAEVRRELEALREAAEERALAAHREAEARRREIAAQQEAEAQRELAVRLELEAQREQAARREAEAQREESARRAAEAQRELAMMRAAAEQRVTAACREAEARREMPALELAEAQAMDAIQRDGDTHRGAVALPAAPDTCLAGGRDPDGARLGSSLSSAAADEAPVQGDADKSADRQEASSALLRRPRTAPDASPAAMPGPATPLKQRLRRAVMDRIASGPPRPTAAAALSPQAEEDADWAAAAPSDEADTSPADPPRAHSVVKAAKRAAEATTASADAGEGRDAAAGNKRRDRRVAAQTPALLWREGMSQAISCTIKDKSASGAMLQFAPDRISDEITEVVIGDKLTLSISNSRERTSVACVVVRISGRRCGVRFCGQFHTEINKPRKLPKAAAPEKPGKSMFSLPGLR